MVDWTTIIISVGASLLGGLASGRYQVNKSFKKDQKKERERESENWYHKINSICLRIYQESLRLPPNESININYYRPQSTSENVDLTRLNQLMDELLERHTEEPADIDRHLLNKIEYICFEYENIEPKLDSPTTTDIKDLIQGSEDQEHSITAIMELASERSKRYDRPPHH